MQVALKENIKMIDKNLKAKLDELLIHGHIESEEYKQIIASSTDKSTDNKSNKKIIIFSIILLLIYGIFITYQKAEAHQKMEKEQMIQFDINQAIQNGRL